MVRKQDYSWLNTIGVDILGFRITFADKVDPKIRELIESLKNRLPEWLKGMKIKQQANQAWDKSHATIRLYDNPDIWLRLAPSAVGFNGFNVSGRTFTATVMLQTLTETHIGKQPNRPAPIPLPQLLKTTSDNKFNLALPVFIPYDTLREAAKLALKSGEFQNLNLPNIGQVRVNFADFEIHQTTENRIAIGLKMEIDPPSNIFDVKGELWLVSALGIDSGETKIKLNDLSVYSQTDNAPIDMLVSVFNMEIVNSAIRKSLEYDYSDSIKQALAGINSVLSKPLSEELRILGRAETIDVESVKVDANGLVIALAVKGIADIRFGK